MKFLYKTLILGILHLDTAFARARAVFDLRRSSTRPAAAAGRNQLVNVYFFLPGWMESPVHSVGGGAGRGLRGGVPFFTPVRAAPSYGCSVYGGDRSEGDGLNL